MYLISDRDENPLLPRKNKNRILFKYLTLENPFITTSSAATRSKNAFDQLKKS